MSGRILFGIASSITGVLLMGLAYLMVGGDFSKFNIRNGKSVEKTYSSESAIEKIEIKETSGEISIEEGDVEKPEVWYQENDNQKYDIKEENGVLKIEKVSDGRNFFFNFDFSSKDLKVTVPKDYKGEIKVKCTSGSTVVDSVNAAELTIDNTSGSVRIRDTRVSGDLKVGNTSGSVHISDCEAENIDVTNTSGSIRFDDTEAFDSFSAKGTSGSIKFNSLKTGGDITVSNTSGSIRGTIIGDKDDYKITAGASSGSCNLKNTSKGDKELNANVKSGSIKIEFE